MGIGHVHLLHGLVSMITAKNILCLTSVVDKVQDAWACVRKNFDKLAEAFKGHFSDCFHELGLRKASEGVCSF